MARPLRLRNISRSLGLGEDEVLRWLAKNAPAAGVRHPADFVPLELVHRIKQALRGPVPRPVPLEVRCPECMRYPVPPGVRLVGANADAACAVCRGSVNKRAAMDLVETFRARGLRRLLVVGGGPGTAEDLRALLGEIEVRIVDGESHRNATQADAELRWADVVAVWSSTILPHKVSKLYTDHRAELRDKLVIVPRRGVAALCQAVTGKVTGVMR